MIPELVDKRLLTPIIIKEVSVVPPVPVQAPVPAPVPAPAPSSDIVSSQVSSILKNTPSLPSTDKKFSLNYICLLLTGFIFYILWSRYKTYEPFPDQIKYQKPSPEGFNLY